MHDGPRPSAPRRLPASRTFLALGAALATAAISASATFAVTSASGASNPATSLNSAPAAGDASMLASFDLAPTFSPADEAALGAIAQFVDAASKPTSTASPTPTPQATSTPIPPPTPLPPTNAPAPTRAAVEAPPQVAPAAPPPTPVSPPPPPPPAPPAARTSGLDTSPMDAASQQLFDLTNRRRVANGLAPLRPNGDLNGIARIRSRDMADHNYFAHISPVTGDGAFSLMDKYGVPYDWAGENLARNNYSTGETIGVAEHALWGSPPHRENIVNPHYTDMGIALVVDAAGMKYFTIVFTGPA